jgi:hypothetical protein
MALSHRVIRDGCASALEISMRAEDMMMDAAGKELEQLACRFAALGADVRWMKTTGWRSVGFGGR